MRGLHFILYGPTGVGKSVNALSSAFIDRQFRGKNSNLLVRKGLVNGQPEIIKQCIAFPDVVADAIESGRIPEVKKVYLVDSELQLNVYVNRVDQPAQNQDISRWFDTVSTKFIPLKCKAYVKDEKGRDTTELDRHRTIENFLDVLRVHGHEQDSAIIYDTITEYFDIVNDWFRYDFLQLGDKAEGDDDEKIAPMKYGPRNKRFNNMKKMFAESQGLIIATAEAKPVYPPATKTVGKDGKVHEQIAYKPIGLKPNTHEAFPYSADVSIRLSRSFSASTTMAWIDDDSKSSRIGNAGTRFEVPEGPFCFARILAECLKVDRDFEWS